MDNKDTQTLPMMVSVPPGVRRVREDNIEAIAKVCHEAHKAYCESIGDMSQKHWPDAEQWQKDAVIQGVKFFLLNPEATPADSHDDWVRKKLSDGWKYGPEKDAEKKTHPDMVLFDKMSPDAQKKDKLLVSIIRALGH